MSTDGKPPADVRPAPALWRALFYLRRRRGGQRLKKAQLWLSIIVADIPAWYLGLAVLMYAGLWIYYAAGIEQGGVTVPTGADAATSVSFAALETDLLLALVFGGLWGGEPPGRIGGADAQIWPVPGAPGRYVLVILLESLTTAALISLLAVVLPLPLWRLLGFRLTGWSAIWLWVQGFFALGAAANVRWLAAAFRRQALAARLLLIVAGVLYGLLSIAAGIWRTGDLGSLGSLAPNAGSATARPAASTFATLAASVGHAFGGAEIGPVLAGAFVLLWAATALAAVLSARRVSADELTRKAELMRQMRLAAVLGLGEERQALAERLRGRSRRKRRSFPGYVDIDRGGRISRRAHAVRSLAWRDLAGLAKTRPSRAAAALIIAAFFGRLWQTGVIPGEWAPLVGLTGIIFAGATLLGSLERDVRWPDQAKLLPLGAAELVLGHLRIAWAGLVVLLAVGAVGYLAAATPFNWLLALVVAAAIAPAARVLAASCAAGILSLEREYDRPLEEFYRSELMDPLMMWLGLAAVGFAGLAAFRLSGGSIVALVAASGAAAIPVAWWLERWSARKLDRLWARSVTE